MFICKFVKFHPLFLVIVLTQILGEEQNAMILIEKASLLSFRGGIVLDPQNNLQSWNISDSRVCSWFGVKCNDNKTHIVELDLSSQSLRGTLSSSLSSLSYLTILDLSDNFFEGNIPEELGKLSRLKQLSLSSNLLEGYIPTQLGDLQQLVYLSLGSNRLKGEIPKPLFSNGSSFLEYLDISNNSLTGSIPLDDHCELRELRYLLLWSNELVGEVPRALSNSSKLEWIDLESNFFTGELPTEIVNKMSQLQFLYLSYNNFISHDGNTNLQPFFSSLANSPNLQELELAGNNISGELTSFIGNLSINLVQLHLDNNLIYGPIAPTISNLFNLTLLNLSSNFINGTIPSELCRLRKLERLYLSDNSLTGEVPSNFGDIPHLGLLDLSKNKLSGSIPDTFANLSQLRRLFLYENQLSGTIPLSLGKCINLEILDLARNKISGEIPSQVAGLSSLKLYLNLSSNLLQGEIPLELSKMDMVLAIDLSSNNISGPIPTQLGSCIALEHLNLSKNVLEGPLPYSIGQLPYLKDLDLSFNKLTGAIPESLHGSSTLERLNLSFNNFRGNVSSTGAFSSLNVDSFLGNERLCGSIQGMASCKKKKSYKKVIYPIVFSVSGTLFLCLFVYPLARKSKLQRQFTTQNSGKGLEKRESHNHQEEIKYPRISHRQLIEATGGFASSSLIGSGGFGHVYKGTLRDNTKIAVKVIDTKTALELSGSFKRECQVLKHLRHRNLIKIITICSKPDFKAIVLPLMPNGSLEDHLYSKNGLRQGLDLVQVLSICSDVAEGLAYLHHHSPVRVVHCDLKPSNILLDEDMTALVTDFGISKLVKDDDEKFVVNDSASYSSGHGLLCGSVGYIAPEYGLGKRASIQGDVYSFGVLLLEIVTGKRPTDLFFHEGLSIHEWVKSFYPNKLKPVVEEALGRYTPNTSLVYDKNIWHDMISELIELGLICTQYNPSTRPTMLDVANEMAQLKQYVSPHSALIIEEVCDKVIVV